MTTKRHDVTYGKRQQVALPLVVKHVGQKLQMSLKEHQDKRDMRKVLNNWKEE